MDNVQNCDSYINIPSSETNKCYTIIIIIIIIIIELLIDQWDW
jgi:uncharacterized integral membrane protein